jgi:hypothetical protein
MTTLLRKRTFEGKSETQIKLILKIKKYVIYGDNMKTSQQIGVMSSPQKNLRETVLDPDQANSEDLWDNVKMFQQIGAVPCESFSLLEKEDL